MPLDEPMVVAKYIDNPLLVNGHKWDLRLYVVVTSYDPLIIYLYEEGLVRCGHLTYLRFAFGGKQVKPGFTNYQPRGFEN